MTQKITKSQIKPLKGLFILQINQNKMHPFLNIVVNNDVTHTTIMETINFKNYRIEKGEKEINGQIRPVAKCYKATPKAKYLKDKIVFNNYFMSVEQMEQHIAKFIGNIERYDADKNQRKQAKADAKANMVNPFKVGDIVVNSWGWEQTNQDFYEIIGVSKKSVKMREISKKLLEYTGNGMAGRVIGIKGDFIGDEINKNLQVYLNSEGIPVIYIKSKHGSMSLWDGSPEYCSWYA